MVVVLVVVVVVAQVADTVLVVPGGGPAQVLTNQAEKAWDKISYTLDQQESVSCRVGLGGLLTPAA